MFCDDCVKQIYGILNDHEKAVLYFLKRRQRGIEYVKEKIGTTKGIIASPSFEKIGESLNCTKAMSRNYVTFLFRLGLVSREKEDHSWTYSLTEAGEKVISIAMENNEVDRLARLLSMKKEEEVAEPQS